MRSGKAIAAIGTLALLLAGCGEESPDTQERPSPSIEADATFVAVDTAFSEAPDRLPAGELTIALVNDGGMGHDLVIEELDDLQVVGVTPGGQTGSGTVTLEPGTYTYYCSVPGHRESGMEGTLTVE